MRFACCLRTMFAVNRLLVSSLSDVTYFSQKDEVLFLASDGTADLSERQFKFFRCRKFSVSGDCAKTAMSATGESRSVLEIRQKGSECETIKRLAVVRRVRGTDTQPRRCSTIGHCKILDEIVCTELDSADSR